MPAYLLLLEPSPNRVYREVAPTLVAEEARRLLSVVTGATVEVEPTQRAGAHYLGVELTEPLDAVGFQALSSLSGVYAIFTAEGELLRPVAAERVDRYPSDLLTIQKYQGKTNEQLTRTLLNLTAAVSAHPQRLLDGTLTVLDPMCGRGTTLNLALTYGLNVTGIDLDKRDFEEYERFLKTWLRQHRYKHTADSGSLRTSGRHRGRRFDVTVAPTKEEFKQGDVQRITYLNTDTTDLDGLLKPRQFDVLVTDSPYGVQHGSHGDRIARNPLELLEDALPGWVPLLRRGGALGMAYNRHVASPDQLGELLEGHGLAVVGDPADETFRHRVDASIDRDLIFATRPD
ncbi:TRM11 family SAM-dependent methyltransferase [Demetria terragena]|uniref:TRM11 family SAM-dependent methyltransferase n=1 Tax=Demetria terragena TaxID=63959 RepID=UPI00035C53B7|nr:hypothetical protein [Demetria terragena]